MSALTDFLNLEIVNGSLSSLEEASKIYYGLLESIVRGKEPTLDLVVVRDNYTATSNNGVILADASLVPITITLPLSSSVISVESGATKFLIVKKVDATAYAVTINVSGSDTIDGASSFTLASANQAVMLIPDGTEWLVVGSQGFGGGGGGVTDHGALTGLLDDDHPQYLLVNGTRALTGNLAVNSGVTIDGIDISAEATTNASHRTNTSNPHSVTATQVGAVPTSRTVSTAGAATGGGALSADITITVAADAAQGTTSTRQIGTTTPIAIGGTATAGVSLIASAADHVHPITETSGPTVLTIGSIADGEYVRRSGTTLIGGTPAGGGSSGYGILPAAATAVALWRFDGALTDDSGNGITITAAAGTPQYERGPNGRGGVIFENSGRLTATNALLAPSGASGTISVEMLFRSGAFNNQNILGVLTAGFASINYNIVMEPTGLVYYAIDGGGFFDFRCNRRVPMDGLFHHVVVTREVTGGNTNLAWFIDGQACGTVTRAQLPSGAAGNTLTILNNPDNSGAVTFPSALGGLAIHNAVLSPATILSRAQAVLPPNYI